MKTRLCSWPCSKKCRNFEVIIFINKFIKSEVVAIHNSCIVKSSNAFNYMEKIVYRHKQINQQSKVRSNQLLFGRRERLTQWNAKIHKHEDIPKAFINTLFSLGYCSYDGCFTKTDISSFAALFSSGFHAPGKFYLNISQTVKPFEIHLTLSG